MSNSNSWVFCLEKNVLLVFWSVLRSNFFFQISYMNQGSSFSIRRFLAMLSLVNNFLLPEQRQYLIPIFFLLLHVFFLVTLHFSFIFFHSFPSTLFFFHIVAFFLPSFLYFFPQTALANILSWEHGWSHLLQILNWMVFLQPTRVLAFLLVRISHTKDKEIFPFLRIRSDIDHFAGSEKLRFYLEGVFLRSASTLDPNNIF